MAHADSLPDVVLDGIAQQLGQYLPRLAKPPLPGAQGIELCESFALWRLGRDSLTASAQTGDDLSQLAKPTGRWHHQLKVDGQATMFARSTQSDAASYVVRAVSVSPLAERIDQAIDWVDQNIQARLFARLLVVSAYRVHAFWLVSDDEDDDQVLIIDAPPQFTDLRPLQLFNSRAFLEALLREPQVIGIDQ